MPALIVPAYLTQLPTEIMLELYYHIFYLLLLSHNFMNMAALLVDLLKDSISIDWYPIDRDCYPLLAVVLSFANGGVILC